MSRVARIRAVIAIVAIGILGAAFLQFSKAANPSVSLELESGTVVSPAAKKNDDPNASGGSYITFKRPLSAATVHIMPLGDSITAGDSAGPTVINGYRGALLSLLTGYSIQYVGSQFDGTYHHESAGGSCIGPNPATPPDWGSACWSRNMYVGTAGWINAYQPDIVIMQGGSNDFCCGGHDVYPNNEQIVTNSFIEWVNLIFATKPDVYIVVIGALDYHPIFKANLQSFVAAQSASGKKIYYVSSDGVSTVDTVHPDVAGYQTLASRLAPIIQTIIQ